MEVDIDLHNFAPIDFCMDMMHMAQVVSESSVSSVTSVPCVSGYVSSLIAANDR